MITKDEAEELELDDFNYDGVEDDTMNSPYYEIGVMAEYEDNYYQRNKLDELISNKIQDFKDEMLNDDLDYRKSELEDIRHEVISSTTYYPTIFISKYIFDKYLDNREYQVECFDYEWLDVDTDEECHAYLLGTNRDTLTFVLNGLDDYFNTSEDD